MDALAQSTRIPNNVQSCILHLTALALYNTHEDIETLTPASNKVHKLLWLIGAIARLCLA
jgi:hypothetical protein